MSKLPTTCPGCGQSLEVTRLTCHGCAMSLDGTFELPELLRLNREDLEFVLAFVRCSGSLKDLGAQRRQSYPTVRNRLNDIIARLNAGASKRDVERERRAILDAIARGMLSVQEASKKLKHLE